MVQHPIRVTTLGCLPTCFIVTISARKSSSSSGVARSEELKNNFLFVIFLLCLLIFLFNYLLEMVCLFLNNNFDVHLPKIFNYAYFQIYYFTLERLLAIKF
jgi:flagellar biosynthesis protein FlhB